MRSVGYLSEEKQARSFSEYLTLQKIENTIRNDDHGNWVIWVYSEDLLQTAEQHFADFKQNPNNPIYQRKIFAPTNSKKTSSSNIINVRAHWNWYQQYRIGPFTLALLMATTMVFGASRLGDNIEILQNLLITKIKYDGYQISWYKGLLEIRSGEIWRLITPAFIHFGIMHFMFNMLMLYQIGTMIEREKGTWLVAAQFFVMGILANLAQYYTAHPMFGGMSGVLYGMFGYVWILNKYDRYSRLFMPKQTINVMLIWFVVCLTGLIGPIANSAHTAGLVTGMIWGYISAILIKRKRKPF